MKPHITKCDIGYQCAGMGYVARGITAPGAYVEWIRYVALRILCGQMRAHHD